MVANRTREMRLSGMTRGRTETRTMDKAKRARTAETPKQPSLGLKLRAPFPTDGRGDPVRSVQGGKQPGRP